MREDTKMNKRRIGIASAAVLSAAGVVLSQTHNQPHDPSASGANRRNPPLTPEGKAILERKDHLTDVAAAALDAGRYEEAETAARQAMSLASDSGVNQEVLASALEAQGRTEEALREYQRMADQGNDHPRNLLPYALLLLKAGHWEQAVEAYNKQWPGLGDPFRGGKAALMSTLGPFSPDVPRPRELAIAIHISLGVIYAGATWGRHSQDDKALREFEQAVALAPGLGLTHLYYGHKLRKLGRRAEAQAAFRRAAALGHGAVKAAAEEALK